MTAKYSIALSRRVSALNREYEALRSRLQLTHDGAAMPIDKLIDHATVLKWRVGDLVSALKAQRRRLKKAEAKAENGPWRPVKGAPAPEEEQR